MRVAVFGTKPYDCAFLDAANGGRHALRYLEPHLTHDTAALAGDATTVCTFVNDTLDRPTLTVLAAQGVKLVALRCAGFNQIDLPAARDLGIAVARVPGYSPHAIAEHATALILSLDRKIHRAWARVREGNFALDGLLGFDLHGRTVGVVGTGQIGLTMAGIMRGFGCEVLAFDPAPSPALASLGGTYVELDTLLARADIVTLHCPLTPATRHLIDAAAIARMKHGVMLINTSRGAVIDTQAVINGLKSGRIGYLGLDVYEEEGDLFFEDLSDQTIQDDVFARLLTFPNVLITGHQAFFTSDAMSAIAATTIANISSFEETGEPLHPVSVERIA